MMANNARKFLNELFYESNSKESPEGEDSEKLAKAQAKEQEKADIGGSAKSSLKEREAELVKILKKIGIEDPASRIEIKQGTFRLTSTCEEQHAADREILYDLTKIVPLVDKNFVAVDVEKNNDQNFSFIIIASDLLPDAELDPDIEDVNTKTEKEPKGDKFLDNPNPKGTEGSPLWQNTGANDKKKKTSESIDYEDSSNLSFEDKVLQVLDDSIDDDYCASFLTDDPEKVAVDLCAWSPLFSNLEDCGVLIPIIQKWQSTHYQSESLKRMELDHKPEACPKCGATQHFQVGNFRGSNDHGHFHCYKCNTNGMWKEGESTTESAKKLIDQVLKEAEKNYPPAAEEET
jgi:transposase-like protein